MAAEVPVSSLRVWTSAHQAGHTRQGWQGWPAHSGTVPAHFLLHPSGRAMTLHPNTPGPSGEAGPWSWAGRNRICWDPRAVLHSSSCPAGTDRPVSISVTRGRCSLPGLCATPFWQPQGGIWRQITNAALWALPVTHPGGNWLWQRWEEPAAPQSGAQTLPCCPTAPRRGHRPSKHLSMVSAPSS